MHIYWKENLYTMYIDLHFVRSNDNLFNVPETNSKRIVFPVFFQLNYKTK